MLQLATAGWGGFERTNDHVSARRSRAAIATMSMMTGASGSSSQPLAARHASLVRAIAIDQDRNSFAELFDHFAPRLKSFLLRQGANDGSAEDLAQEAMLAVWRKAALFDPTRASASTWIFTIARNLRIDAIRKQARPEFDPDDPAFVGDNGPAADEAMSTEEMGERVRSALAELPEEQAQVIRLSFYEDKPHSAIASQLSLPIGTVKSRLRLAMKRIRAVLGEEQ